MIEDTDRCYAALRGRDPRFDGWLFVAVTSTGIYCRPSCPAMTPRRENVRFHATSASAQAAGFRACKRCRPDATPGSPEWDVRADVVGRAMRLIADGVVDREGVGALAARLGYSTRHLNRQLTAEVGAGPLALARAQRAQSARVLIETTALPFAEVAFAAGFSSIRQFNDTVREVFATTPSGLRARARRGAVSTGAETLVLRLPYRAPAALGLAIEHLAARAVHGVEQVTEDGRYRRSLSLPHGEGTVDLSLADGHVQARLQVADLRDVVAAVQRCRRVLDLDADPVAIDERLGEDPALAAAVAALPGLRVPGTVDPVEIALRTVLGQQVSVAAARRFTERLVEAVGEPLRSSRDGLTRRFPDAAAIAEADLSGIGLTRSRAATLRAVAGAVVGGDLQLDVGADRSQLRHALLEVRGVGPWTVEEIMLRAVGDPDAFPATDLALLRVAASLGLPDRPRELAERSARWQPWRAYAAQHLWVRDAQIRQPVAA